MIDLKFRFVSLFFIPFTMPSSSRNKRKRSESTSIDTLASNVKLLTPDMKICFDIIDKLMKYPQAFPFNEPVDWKSAGLWSYPKIIKRPMDLGTIKKKLLKREVKDINKFEELVRLVFENSMLFNIEGSQIYNDAQYLLHEFEDSFDLSFNNEITIDDHESSNIESKETIINEEDLKAIRELAEKASKLEKELEKNIKIYEEEKKKLLRFQGTKLKRIKLTEPRKPLTYEEKEELCRKITELDSEHLTMLLDLISNQNSNEGDEIEIDIENLDNSTLIRVQLFVDKHLKK